MDDTYDPVRGVGVRSGRPPTEWQGPRRKAPDHYAGQSLGRHRMHHRDVERNPNGSLPGKRDKAARRMIRKALKAVNSKPERDLKLPRAMQAQTRDLMAERADGTQRTADGARHAAKRLFEKELAIHTPRPNEPTRAERREYARQLKRAGKKDAIAQLVDAVAAGKKL